MDIDELRKKELNLPVIQIAAFYAETGIGYEISSGKITKLVCEEVSNEDH